MSIEATRTGFESSFEESNFYNKQTQDEKHLNSILKNSPAELMADFLIGLYGFLISGHCIILLMSSICISPCKE